MIKMIIAGNLGNDAQVHAIKGEETAQFISFNVAVNLNEEKTSWVECTKQYKNGVPEKFAEALKKGKAVTVIGFPYAKAYLKDEVVISNLAMFIDELTFQ